MVAWVKLQPCGHVAVCHMCSEALIKCPLCSKIVSHSLPVSVDAGDVGKGEKEEEEQQCEQHAAAGGGTEGRLCSICSSKKSVIAFSKKQWGAKAHVRKCLQCVETC